MARPHKGGGWDGMVHLPLWAWLAGWLAGWLTRAGWRLNDHTIARGANLQPPRLYARSQYSRESAIRMADDTYTPCLLVLEIFCSDDPF